MMTPDGTAYDNVEEVWEDMPDGRCKTTTYYLDGQMVRRDLLLELPAPPGLEGKTFHFAKE